MDAAVPLYYEDIEVGAVRRSPKRTITVADIVNFAGLTGDFAELHLSDIQPEGGLYHQRIAHGLLGMVVQSAQGGQAYRVAGLALLSFEHRFVAPLFPDDTVQTYIHAADKRLSASRPGTGIVTWQRDLVNQHDKIVQTGKSLMLVSCLPTAS